MIRFLPTPGSSTSLLSALPTEEADAGVGDVAVPIASIVLAAVIALAVSALIGAVVGRIARRSAIAADLTRRSRVPLRSVLVIIAVWIALRVSTDVSDWRRAAEHVLLIALIVALTWLVGSLAFVFEDAALARYRTDVADNRHARRVRTQVQVLRRVTVAILVVCAAAGIALTFPSARAFGASLLASAGLLSIVAGLAAQSSLANVFAGMQLAFTDAIRVDDVVVVNGQWGRIEELTLTYVVVHAWDDRRLILPSTYFTTTPFENWTRRAAELLGTVELDVDWEVPVSAMRNELTRLLEATDLWDRRVGILQVVDAVGGSVRVRALASAADAPTLFDLRCYVREGLVAWAQREAPHAMPRTRWEQGTGPVRGVEPAQGPAVGGALRPDSAATRAPVDAGPDVGPLEDGASTGPLPLPGAWTVEDTQALRPVGSDSRLFTGSIEALERSRHFQGPGQDVMDEREHNAEGGGSPARGESMVSPGPGGGSDLTGTDAGEPDATTGQVTAAEVAAPAARIAREHVGQGAVTQEQSTREQGGQEPGARDAATRARNARAGVSARQPVTEAMTAQDAPGADEAEPADLERAEPKGRELDGSGLDSSDLGAAELDRPDLDAPAPDSPEIDSPEPDSPEHDRSALDQTQVIPPVVDPPRREVRRSSGHRRPDRPDER